MFPDDIFVFLFKSTGQLFKETMLYVIWYKFFPSTLRLEKYPQIHIQIFLHIDYLYKMQFMEIQK